MLFLSRRESRELLEFLGEGGCFIPLFVFLIFVAFLASLVRILNLIPKSNRLMEPGQIWLNLIPVFNIVWLPVTVDRIGESLRNELQDLGLDRRKDGYGKSVGFTCLVLSYLGLFTIPFGFLFWVFGTAYWIAYWIQMGWYARRLKSGPREYAPPVDEGW